MQQIKCMEGQVFVNMCRSFARWKNGPVCCFNNIEIIAARACSCRAQLCCEENVATSLILGIERVLEGRFLWPSFNEKSFGISPGI